MKDSVGISKGGGAFPRVALDAPTEAIVQLGLMLIATPIARVALAAVGS